MNLTPIINEIADRADDFLEGATSREQAFAGIFELLNADYPMVSSKDQRKVAEAVMEILTEEEFFTHDPGEFSGGGSSSDENEDD